jgi:AcrR family transcriptional regulator
MSAQQHAHAGDHGGAWDHTLSEHRQRQAEHIVAAAMGIIARDGVAALTMSAVAEEAGISRQTLYKYFPDVDAVLVGMTRLSEAVEWDLAERAERAEDATAGLLLFVEASLAAATAGHPSPAALASTLPPEARASLQAHVDRVESLVVRLMRRGLEDGSFRSDLDPELDGRLVYGMVMAAHDLAERTPVDASRLAEHVAKSVFRVVAVKPS